MPFFKTARLNLSVEWRSLAHGSLVSEAEFLSPELNLVQARSKDDSQLGGEENWNARLEELFPFRFNTIRLVDGTVRFLAPGISTRDAITARHVSGAVSNLTNVLDAGKRTFADFQVQGEVLDGAPAVVKGSVDAFAAKPTFDVNLEVRKVQLPQVNPWLREYIKADAEAGKFELYLELAAADEELGARVHAREEGDLDRGGGERNPQRVSELASASLAAAATCEPTRDEEPELNRQIDGGMAISNEAEPPFAAEHRLASRE